MKRTIFAIFLACSVLAAACLSEPSRLAQNTAQPPQTSLAQPSPTPSALPRSESYQEIALPVSDESGIESVSARFWPAPTPTAKYGIVFVTGVDGGFLEPVDGIYSRIAAAMLPKGIASIFVSYRTPGDLEPSVADALSAIAYLKNAGVTRVAIVGWSFGGAVIVNTAVRAPEVITVVGFSPQDKDAEPVELFQKQSLLLFHSDADENVPFEAGRFIFDDAPSSIRKQFVPLNGADHELNGMGDTVDPVVIQWLNREFGL